MAGIFSRIFGKAQGDPTPDHQATSHTQAGEVAINTPSLNAQIMALQTEYWRYDQPALTQLEALGLEQLRWRDVLRLHHHYCARWASEHPHGCAALRPEHALLLEHLCAPNSPFRPRHAFVWQGDGPPEGEDIPYSTHQGQLCNGALSHLGSIEVVRLEPAQDGSLRAGALEFIAFDDIMTIAVAPSATEDLSRRDEAPKAARILYEYSRGDSTVLLAPSYAPLCEPEPPATSARYWTTSGLNANKLPDVLAPGQLIGGGAQRLRRLSDFAAEGIAEFDLNDCYQISLAIEVGDPRFEQKCRGRQLDPSQMRADLQREQAGRQPTAEGPAKGKKLRLRTL